MEKPSERQKVSAIVRALEAELNGTVFLNNPELTIGRLEVVRKGFGSELGRPDALVWVTLDLHVLGVVVTLRVPILVEAEEAGINAAKEDFELFFERESLQIPMVVVAGDRAPRRTEEYRAKANVAVKVEQIGFDRVRQR